MARSQVWDLLIVGAGIAGISTAIWARRLGLSCAVLEGADRAGGQLWRIAQPIADYPGLAPASGGEMAARLQQQAVDSDADLLYGCPVQVVNAAERTCSTDEGTVCGRLLVMATGLLPRRLGVPGEDLPAELGLVRRPSQEPDWFRGRRVAVVGGGDRAAENALLLAPIAAQVWLLHRGDRLRARQAFQESQQQAAGVSVVPSAAVTSIGWTGLELELSLSGTPDRLPVDALCLYIGNRPNSDLVRGQVGQDPEGYIEVDRHGQTSMPGVYAVGDVCTAPAYQSLSVAAGQAMMVAKHAALALGR